MAKTKAGLISRYNPHTLISLNLKHANGFLYCKTKLNDILSFQKREMRSMPPPGNGESFDEAECDAVAVVDS